MILALGLSVILLGLITDAKNITCNTLCIRGPDNTTETCNTTTGECLYGCNVGFAGPNCSYKCPDSCLHPADNETGTCDHISGECLHGCKEGFAGLNCSILCPENCLSDERGMDICDETTEQCLFGCKDGFHGSNCTGKCSDVDTLCEKCSASDGDIGIECKKCIRNFYLSAGKCRACNYWCVYLSISNEQRCRQEDGYCNHGCRPGRYGFMCNNRCRATCKDECHRETGCKEGSYGNNCENNCSATCLNNKCERADGSCTDGCITGYEGHNCEIETKSVDKFLLGFAISGWALFVTLLAFVITTAVRRRLAKSKRNEQNSVEDTQAQTINQQVYTTLQHEQDENDDKTKYEVLRLGRENSTGGQADYENSGL